MSFFGEGKGVEKALSRSEKKSALGEISHDLKRKRNKCKMVRKERK